MVAKSSLYRSVENFEAENRVRGALLDVDRSRFERVSVNAFCGIIELCGTVRSFYDKSLAIQVAEQVPGISTVVESIAVRATDPRGIAERRTRHQESGS
jgi:osmotically-inducible protein OsmY